MDELAELHQNVEGLGRELRELTRLLESSQDVFYRTDAQGRLTFITPSIERYAGYTPAELIGRFAHEVYADPGDRKKLVEELRRTGSVIDYGVRLVDRSGQIHYVSVNARAFFEKGEYTGVEGVMRDTTRRKNLELEIGKNEQRFRMLAESSPVGIFLSGADDNCLFVNPRWCEIAGISKEEALGKGWIKAIHPEDRERVVLERNSAGAERRGFEVDCRFQTPQGKVSVIHANAAMLKDEQGQFAGFIGTITDVTRLHQAEQVTRNLGSIMESFQDAIIVFTLDGVILNWNRAAERIYGYSAAEVIGRHANTFSLAVHHWEQVKGLLDRLLSGQFLEPIRATRSRKDGTSVHVSITYSILRDMSGQPIGATSVSRDITQRRLEQEALQRSEELFRAVFERGAVGIAMIGEDLRFERVNPFLSRMLGRTADELQGMKVSEVTHPDDVERGSQLARSLLLGEIPYYSLEKRYLRKDGSVVWAHLTAAAIPYSEDNPALGLAMIEDISESRKYEQEREKIIAQLQEALANVKTLSGLLPMCSWCKKIRDERGAWSDVEVYVHQRSDADFTHGICPECQDRVRRELDLGIKDPGAV